MTPSPNDRLDHLQREIQTATDHSQVLPPKPQPLTSSAAERAGMRAGSELIGGIVGGLMFGYGIDYMLSTRPYGLIIGLFLGVAAGFYGVYRYTTRTK